MISWIEGFEPSPLVKMAILLPTEPRVQTLKYPKIGYSDQVYPCFKYLMPSLFITIVLLFLSQFFIMPMSKQDVAVDDVNSGAAAVATPQR